MQLSVFRLWDWQVAFGRLARLAFFINGTTSTHLLNGVQSNVSADEGVLC